MKRIIYIAALISTFNFAAAQQIVEDSYTQLRVHYDVPEVTFDETSVCGEKFVHPSIEGYMLGGQFGSPAVPYLSSLLTIPFCDGFEVTFEGAAYDTIDLPKFSIMPQQPPRSKSDTTASILVRDNEIYSTDAYSGLPLASVEHAGIARDRNLAYLRFSPISINPVTAKAVVCRKADIIVRYINPDRNATISHYERYHTPAFNYGHSLNTLGLSSNGSAVSPVRLTIVAPSMLECSRLHSFADWKRRQGMMVDIITTDRSGSGATNEIKTALQNLYNNASVEDPAPTYVIIIGDHGQLAAYNNQMPSNYYTNAYGMRNHITDLYYTTWTSGDYLPDAYYGRFSATDTVTLARIINKTILYESYSFDDDSYLSKAILISGIDGGDLNDNAYKYSDPTMDYVALQYINDNQGFNDVRYYKNRTSYAPSGVSVTGSSKSNGIADTLRNLYNQGYGWINYSAHGNWNEWSIPNFSVSNAQNMSNTGMPSVMIGNCCLSNKFDKGECLGEALLRRGDNAGAAAYIGASQETFWTHDFYWSVGLRNSNEFSGTSVPSYSGNRLGSYDHLFHTHNESLEQHATTVGSMMYYGNMAVQSVTGDETAALFAQYYWEIYNVMGDPSLMPWLGKAMKMPFSIDTSNTTSLLFTSVPNVYVAVIDTGTLEVVGCTYADATGYGEISLPQEVELKQTFISATAQGYQPYISNIDNVNLGLNVSVRSYPNPASTNLNIVGSGIREVTIATPSGTIIATYTVGANYYNLDLSNIQPGLYLVIVASDEGISAQRIVRL